MRGQPAGVVVAAGGLAALGLGAVALGLYLAAVGRIAGTQTIMSPFGAALLFIAYGVGSLLNAAALWLRERWAWIAALVLALVGLGISILGVVINRPLPIALVVGIALAAAVTIALLPRRVRAAFRG